MVVGTSPVDRALTSKKASMMLVGRLAIDRHARNLQSSRQEQFGSNKKADRHGAGSHGKIIQH